MIASIDGLGDELRMLRQPVVAALVGESRGFVAQHDDNLVFHVEAGIVVIVEFVGGRAISRENHRGRDLAGGREAERNEILIDLQITLGSRRLYREMVVGFEARARNDRERLGVAIHSRGLQVRVLCSASQSDARRASDPWCRRRGLPSQERRAT